jgi:hypothetical protein
MHIVCFSLELVHCLLLRLSPRRDYTMSRERGKPKRGSTYYNFVARRNRPDPSLPSNPSTSSVSPSRSDQNWLEDPQPPLGNLESPPPISDPMIDSGGCPIEEEIPPSGMETTTTMPEPIDNASPSAHPTMAPGGCVIEEEIPPSWLKDWPTRNVPATTEVAHWLAMEETPSTEFDAATTQHEATVVSTEQVSLNPHHFSEDHLQLIFEMRRNLEDQLHNQSILSPSHGPPVRLPVQCTCPEALSDLQPTVRLHLQP